MRDEKATNKYLLERFTNLVEAFAENHESGRKPGNIFFGDAVDGAGDLMNRPPEATRETQAQQSRQLEKYRLLLSELIELIGINTLEAAESDPDVDLYPIYVKSMAELALKLETHHKVVLVKLACLQNEESVNLPHNDVRQGSKKLEASGAKGENDGRDDMAAE